MFKYLRYGFFPWMLLNDAGGAGTGGGQGAGAGAGPGSGVGSGAAGGGTGAAGGQGAGAGQGQGAGQTNQPFASFPDEASFMARVNREGKAQQEAMAKELGFDSVDAMKAAAKAKKEADEASKTELEKEKAAREKAEKESKSALDAANQRVINAEVKLAAQAAGFADPSDAVALIDHANVKVDDKGEVTGAKEAVEALAKVKPHLLGATKPGGSPGSAGGGQRQTGGGQNQYDNFGKDLAAKRAEQTKAQTAGRDIYFK